MVTSSILGLPAVLLVLMSMSCINLGSEPESAKNKRSVFGGILILLTGKPVFVFLKLRSYITLKNYLDLEIDCSLFLPEDPFYHQL